jgi:hypothetical protein
MSVQVTARVAPPRRFVADLFDEKMKLEIEVTARVSNT